jgi:hypothetical protein
MLRNWELGRVLPNGAYFLAWIQVLGFHIEIVDAEEARQ